MYNTYDGKTFFTSPLCWRDSTVKYFYHLRKSKGLASITLILSDAHPQMHISAPQSKKKARRRKDSVFFEAFYADSYH